VVLGFGLARRVEEFGVGVCVDEGVVRKLILTVVINGCCCAAAKQKASRSSQHFRAKATNRVDDLQGMVSELQQARREGRLKDVALLEEQMHQMLREWKVELREASPASSLLVGTYTSDTHERNYYRGLCSSDCNLCLYEP